MALDLRLQTKLAQQLVMTPQLQQAIKLLQLNHLELADVLQEEMSENPVLEERTDERHDDRSEAGDGTDQFDTSLHEVAGAGEGAEATAEGAPGSRGNDNSDGANPGETRGDEAQVASDLTSVLDGESVPEPTNKEVEQDVDWEAYLDSYSYSLPASTGSSQSDELPPFEATLTKPTSLHDHLRWQVVMQEFGDDDAEIAAMLIEEIDDNGYLSKDALETISDDLALPEVRVENVLRELQQLEPLGVGARDLRECLLIQCQQLHPEAELVIQIIESHLKHVERRNFQAIAKALGVTLADVGEAVQLIATLEPRPGRAFAGQEAQYITPDIYVSKVGDDYVITLNEDGLPKLRVSGYYRRALATSGGTTKSYIQERLRSAAWLIRSIHMRQRTIYRVMESILKFQRDFFDQGVAHLKPLILKDVADDVSMHESTISRVTTNKYVHTPRGIYELKFFFNSSINRIGKESIASESVRDHIKRLIDEEDPRKPYSDQRIVELLKSKDIDIARRTVAKYREMLRIPSSSRRKQVF